MPKITNKRTNGVAVDGALGAGASKLKKKIRDIQRLLKRQNLPADVRIENERALKALNVELADVQQNLKQKTIAKKYHMVRFFEKKKAVRKLKQAQKTYDDAVKTEVRKDIKKARKNLKFAQIDVAYVILFPKSEKYISLYPNEKEEDKATLDNPKAKKGMLQTEQARKEFRKHCEELMDKNELPFSFDDVLQGKTISIVTKATNSNAQEIDAPQEKPQDQEEDDFFE